MNLKAAISKSRKQLENKAKKNGIYENFGQKEVRKLEDKYINSSDYSEIMNTNRTMLQNFDTWCMNYTR